jgi:allophanate hydrolase subunit 1
MAPNGKFPLPPVLFRPLNEAGFLVLFGEKLTQENVLLACCLQAQLRKAPFPGLIETEVVGTGLMITYDPLPLSAMSHKAEDTCESKGYREAKSYVEALLPEVVTASGTDGEEPLRLPLSFAPDSPLEPKLILQGCYVSYAAGFDNALCLFEENRPIPPCREKEGKRKPVPAGSVGLWDGAVLIALRDTEAAWAVIGQVPADRVAGGRSVPVGKKIIFELPEDDFAGRGGSRP